MATIGRHAAVADVRGLKMKGLLGWLAWVFVHIYYLIGFRNRAAVLASWAWNYIVRDRPIRLITRAQPDPLADEVDPGQRLRVSGGLAPARLAGTSSGSPPAYGG